MTWGWPRWVGSIAAGSGSLVGKRIFMTNVHVLNGRTANQVSVELGEYVWDKWTTKEQPLGVGAVTSLLHPPIPVVEIVRPAWQSGLAHLDFAFAILEYEPQVATMLKAATLPASITGFPASGFDTTKFNQYLAKIEASSSWGHFGLTTYTHSIRFHEPC